MSRFVILGAGAIGGGIGARLHQHGHEVVLVARGAHLAAMRARGLRLLTPEGEEVVDVAAVGSPAEVAWTGEDVVVLATKSQDTAAALDALAAAAAVAPPVVCAQNGVANERAALRRFPAVYGMCVVMPATHLEPGVVELNGMPCTGILDLGRYPDGTDDLAAAVAAALEASTFSARAVPDVMRWKYRKLISNLGNAVDALCGRAAHGDEAAAELLAAARAEGVACLAAAGIEVAGEDEDAERRTAMSALRPAAGRRRQGGSTWQSLQRGAPTVETEYLNGEVNLLGRLHGIPTPANELLQERMRAALRDGRPPGGVAPSDLLAELRARRGG